MADLSITQRMRAFEELCRRHGMPVTVQRRVILQAVLASGDHPTADDIHDRIRGRLPEVSKATVYRVLDTLVGLGLIGRAHHPGSAARFDAKTHRHHHLVCTACRRMTDYETPALNDLPLPAPPSGFAVTDYSIQFIGLCPDCRGAVHGRENEPCAAAAEGASGRNPATSDGSDQRAT